MGQNNTSCESGQINAAQNVNSEQISEEGKVTNLEEGTKHMEQIFDKSLCGNGKIPSSNSNGDNKAHSVRAAIDTLIESCLGVKTDESENSDSSSRELGGNERLYSIEKLNMTRKAKITPTTSDDGLSSSDQNKGPVDTMKTLSSFMQHRIVDMIQNGEDESKDANCTNNVSQTEKQLSCSDDNSANKSDVNFGTSSEGHSQKLPEIVSDSQKSDQEKDSLLPKNTVRLQMLIDKVLDNSLGEDIQSSLPEVGGHKEFRLHGDAKGTSSNLEASLQASSFVHAVAKRLDTESVTCESSTKEGNQEMKSIQKNMVCLMDHIEKVLEKSFVTLNHDKEEGEAENTKDKQKRSSPPVQSLSNFTAKQIASQPEITSSQANFSSANSDGTISVQDIVDRVISQTEVISRLLSPGSTSATNTGGKKEYPEGLRSHATEDCRLPSEKAHAADKERMFHQRVHNSVLVTQSGEQFLSGRMSEKPAEGLKRHWLSGQCPESAYHAKMRTQSLDMNKVNQQDYRRAEPNNLSSPKYSPCKESPGVIGQRFGVAFPVSQPQYMNNMTVNPGGVPMSQAPVFRLPGHPVYRHVPFPPPLMRVDGMIPTYQLNSIPHMPMKGCQCVVCVNHFRCEDETSQNHGLHATPSPAGMPSPRTPVDSNYFQHRMATPVHSSQNSRSVLVPGDSHLHPNSPSRCQNPTTMHMTALMQHQTATKSFKSLPYPSHMSNSPKDNGAHVILNGIDQPKTEICPQERGLQYIAQVPPSNFHNGVDSSRINYSPQNHVAYVSSKTELSPSLLREEMASGSNVRTDYAVSLHSRPEVAKSHQMITAASLNPPRNIEKQRTASESVLDLSVKRTDVGPFAETLPSGDQPLDLSQKKPPRREAILDHSPRQNEANNTVHGFSPHYEDPNRNGPISRHLQNLETSVDKYCQQVQRDKMVNHQNPCDPPVPKNMPRLEQVFIPCPPTSSGMVLHTIKPSVTSSGGHRPQLHPIPAPSFATSLIPPTKSVTLQSLNPSHVTVSSSQSQCPDKVFPSNKMTANIYSSPPTPKHLREPLQQRESPHNMDKSDSSQSGGSRRCSVSRHEPIQSIIGNHPPNDILYLICRLCRQTYGSPYGFRKHFRNQHGFEPRAEHTIVQTISATKSAMQTPYLTDTQGFANEYSVPAGRNSAPPEGESCFENVRGTTPEMYRIKKEDLTAMEQKTSSVDLPCQQETALKSRRSFGRSADGRTRQLMKDDKEDTKYLECPECKQTFQLNDFGSYKRHCRQHNHARNAGPFVPPESQFSDSNSVQEHMDLQQSRTAACKFCGISLSLFLIEDHIKSVHFQELLSSSKHLCMDCSAVFQCSEDLQSHVKSMHGSILSQTTSLKNEKSEHQDDTAKPETGINTYFLHPVSTSEPVEVQRLPADPATISASPDSSSDNRSQHLSQGQDSGTPGKGSMEIDSDISLSQRKERDTNNQIKIDSSKSSQSNQVEDDQDSGFSGERCSSSESRSLSTESSSETGPVSSPVEGEEINGTYYRHKKFGNNRKRKESLDNNDGDVKLSKLDSSKDIGSRKGSFGSSDGAVSCQSRDSSPKLPSSEGKGDTNVRASKCISKSDRGTEVTRSKCEGKVKQEGLQKSFVWDRVTRTAAGKNIKPPDYMT